MTDGFNPQPKALCHISPTKLNLDHVRAEQLANDIAERLIASDSVGDDLDKIKNAAADLKEELLPV